MSSKTFAFLATAFVFTAAGAQTPDPGNSDAVKAKAQACVACHGPGGNSQSSQWPSLAGQNWRYLYMQLKDFNEGRRKDELMSPVAAALSKQDMMALAQYFGGQPVFTNAAFQADQAKVDAGKAKADAALCSMCHLGALKGQNEIPRVAGQQHDYVVKQLKDFREKTRANDGGTMTPVAKTLTDADIENLASYASSLR